MPRYSPKHGCAERGCSGLAEAGKKYCAKHAYLEPEKTEAPRKSAYARGYNKRWQRARQTYLANHPLCVECMKQGKYVMATDVDHIIPHRGNQNIFWDTENWQSLCHSCHSKKTNREDHYPEYKYDFR